MNISNAYNFLLLYNYNTVSGEAVAIATGHAMQVFNDLHYSSRCTRFISIVWSVSMASLLLDTVQCLYKSVFLPIIVLMPPSRLPK
jgi:hypothetical protein